MKLIMVEFSFLSLNLVELILFSGNYEAEFGGAAAGLKGNGF